MHKLRGIYLIILIIYVILFRVKLLDRVKKSLYNTCGVFCGIMFNDINTKNGYKNGKNKKT